jgi:small subunit ribosomal protein S9
MSDTPIPPADETPAAPIADEAPAAEAPTPETSAAPEASPAPAVEAPADSAAAPAAAPRVRRRREKRPKPLTAAVGRRKEAVARLRIRPGTGTITINRRPIETYFPTETHRMIVTEALRLTTTADVYDIDASIDGGGTSGQAGALRLGIARALVALDP